MSVTLEDLEIRYKNIRNKNPRVRQCSVASCRNPRDSTKYLGGDTSCAYHRLLFYHWISVISNSMHPKFYHYMANQRMRRGAFTRWRNKLGKAACDKIVLRLAQGGNQLGMLKGSNKKETF